MSRYTIHVIADADCTSHHEEVLAQADYAAQAKALVSDHSNHPFGACIVDHKKGLTDYGWGFGKPSPKSREYFRLAKAVSRKRQEALGLERFEARVHPDDRPAVVAYIARKTRQRGIQK